MAWTPVASVEGWAVGTSRLCDVGENKIAVFHTDEGFFAIDDHCPHRSGPLSEGELIGQEVSCPWHAWIFDLKTGLCRTIPGQKTAVFSTRVREGKVEIDG